MIEDRTASKQLDLLGSDFGRVHSGLFVVYPIPGYVHVYIRTHESRQQLTGHLPVAIPTSPIFHCGQGEMDEEEKRDVTLSQSHLIKNGLGQGFRFPVQSLEYTELCGGVWLTLEVSAYVVQCLFCPNAVPSDNPIKCY